MYVFSHWAIITRKTNLDTDGGRWNPSVLSRFFKWKKLRVKLECSLHQNAERLMLLNGFITDGMSEVREDYVLLLECELFDGY